MYKILGTENNWYLFLINGSSCYDVDDETDQGSRMVSEQLCRLGGHQSVKGRREQKRWSKCQLRPVVSFA